MKRLLEEYRQGRGKNKTTFVTIYGLEYCRNFSELTHKAIGYAEKLGEKASFKGACCLSFEAEN